MKRGIRVVGLVVILFLLLIFGCQSAPEKELASAKAALQKALEAQAGINMQQIFSPRRKFPSLRRKT